MTPVRTLLDWNLHNSAARPLSPAPDRMVPGPLLPDSRQAQPNPFISKSSPPALNNRNITEAAATSRRTRRTSRHACRALSITDAARPVFHHDIGGAVGYPASSSPPLADNVAERQATAPSRLFACVMPSPLPPFSSLGWNTWPFYRRCANSASSRRRKLQLIT